MGTHRPKDVSVQQQSDSKFYLNYMGPLHRLVSFFNDSGLDLNNMGVKGRKYKFSSDLDIFAKESERIKSKAYIWASIRLPKKNNRGKDFWGVLNFCKITKFL